MGLRSTPRGKQAPKRAPRAAVLGVLPQLLRLVAGSPDLLGKLPADIIGLCGEGPETVVLQALLDAHDNATVTSHSLVAMFERFRDSPQEPVLADMLRDRADEEISVEVAAATLDGLLRNLQRAALDHEFQQLHQRLGQGDALDDEEMQRFARLPIEIQKLRTGHTT